MGGWWAPPEVSSTRVRIGRRWVVRKASPTAARSFKNHARLASIDIHSATSRPLKAHVSTTCVPWGLMTLIRWPAVTRAAGPRGWEIVGVWGVAIGPFALARLAAAEPMVSAIVGDRGRAPA